MISRRALPSSLAGAARAALLPLLALLTPGCTAPSISPAPVSHLGRAVAVDDPGELWRRVRQVNDGYGTLTTVQQTGLEITLGPDRSEERSLRGVLAVQRPGSFRATVLGPAGIKLFDLLYVSGKTTVLSVAPQLERSSKLPEVLQTIAGDIAAIYRLDPQLQPAERRLEETVSLASGRAPLYELVELVDGAPRRQTTIFAASLAIARTEEVMPGGEIRTITYGDYERRGELLLPRSIHVAREGTVIYWLSIRVESVKINQALDEQLFLPAERDAT